jgi:hypothetical protein
MVGSFDNFKNGIRRKNEKQEMALRRKGVITTAAKISR